LIGVEKKQSKALYSMPGYREDVSSASVLAITSGKGGVGKTNIAANLSVSLAASNQRVILMDADLGLGNLDVLMNIQTRYNLTHVVSGKRTLEEITHVGPCGVEVICGGSGIESLANLGHFQRQRLLDEMQTLQNRADLIVIDTGAGIHTSVIAFCLAADQTLVVTTPEPTAITDAYAMIKVLASQKYTGRISLLVNMAQSLTEGKKVYRQIAEVSGRFLNTPVYEAGVLCKDDNLLQKPGRGQESLQADCRGFRTVFEHAGL
jgi:flagellar biosynthesis protein FlhG